MTQCKVIFCAIVLGLVAFTVRAQTPSDEELIKAKRAAENAEKKLQLLNSVPGPNRLDDKKRADEAMHLMIGGAGGAGRLVKYKPFSGEAVTETVQVFVDGNRIVRHNIARLYRDSAGRTRREQTIEALGPSSPIATGQIVVIADPVALVDFILDEPRKTARKFAHLEGVGTQADANPPDGVHLGTRTIEGLECVGLKKTSTIPSGAIGNLRPIVTVTETWYASAIEELVHSTTSDPRFGETSYTLHNIVLAEPPRDMFRPPPGYQVQFEAQPGGVMKRAQ
jgi:hypothetical protein